MSKRAEWSQDGLNLNCECTRCEWSAHTDCVYGLCLECFVLLGAYGEMLVTQVDHD